MHDDLLRESLELLKLELERGRIHIPNDMELINSLTRVRYGSDGKVDPSTVDSRVRAIAIGVMGLKQQDALLSIPLKESQEQYFALLDRFFGIPYEQMKKNRLDPYRVASHMASIQKYVRAFTLDLEEFEDGIKEFWNYYSPVVNAHIRQLSGIKSVFGGDIFPSYLQNIGCSTGLYVDTIILPDPILRTLSFFNTMTPEKAVFYLVKHALNAMNYKSLALADVEKPIIVVNADNSLIDPEEFDLLNRVSTDNVLSHLNKIFGTSFCSEDMDSFLTGVVTIEDLKTLVKEPGRILFDVEWRNLSLEERILKWQIQAEPFLALNDLATMPLGLQLKFNAIGRMRQMNDVVLRAGGLNSSPLIDAPTSWEYLVWKYEYDSKQARDQQADVKGFMISQVLTSTNFPLIGKVSDEAIIKLRKENALSELRDTISKGIEEISISDEDVFKEVTEHVVHNIKDALDNHKKQVKDLTARKKKFFGLDIIPLIVSGGLSLAATSTSNPIITTASSISALVLGAPSVKEVITNGRTIIKDNSKLKKSPVGILVRHFDE
ncbi:hypothetical protein [Desulfosporosinus sp. OT]|uniref:hypothetical protein n=1 Tax=Desulfosporosinus sp. OT TaxID=913865 RepID=UPI000223A912|nr:hypothetical protein [Desulfosporosinus sp. OT]EGW39076.1 hypothetical protein DOT_3027 [Desulfosporosinus sp. OT]